jgi:hypothetical protein
VKVELTSFEADLLIDSLMVAIGAAAVHGDPWSEEKLDLARKVVYRLMFGAGQ